jgi:hypothetical protein
MNIVDTYGTILQIYFSDTIRKVLKQHAPEGLAKRFPGARAIRRSALAAIGKLHCTE